MRIRLGLFILGLASVTWAAQPTSSTRTPPRQHESGDARWSDSLVSTTLDTCDPRLLRTEPPRPEDLRYNCVSHFTEVRNESARPIQCRMFLYLNEPVFSPSSGTGHDEIIYPGREGKTLELLAPATSLPKSFSSTCQVVPAETPLVPAAPSDCTMKFEAKYLDDYYPRPAIRRKEEGAAEIDFVIPPERKYADELTLVRSSGIESIDRASMRVMRGARPVTNCKGQRFRGEIQFKLEEGFPTITVRWIPAAGSS